MWSIAILDVDDGVGEDGEGEEEDDEQGEVEAFVAG